LNENIGASDKFILFTFEEETNLIDSDCWRYPLQSTF
jgi:hypothetical protein